MKKTTLKPAVPKIVLRAEDLPLGGTARIDMAAGKANTTIQKKKKRGTARFTKAKAK